MTMSSRSLQSTVRDKVAFDSLSIRGAIVLCSGGWEKWRKRIAHCNLELDHWSMFYIANLFCWWKWFGNYLRVEYISFSRRLNDVYMHCLPPVIMPYHVSYLFWHELQVIHKIQGRIWLAFLISVFRLLSIFCLHWPFFWPLLFYDFNQLMTEYTSQNGTWRE